MHRGAAAAAVAAANGSTACFPSVLQGCRGCCQLAQQEGVQLGVASEEVGGCRCPLGGGRALRRMA